MCDRDEYSEDQWKRQFTARKQRCNCLGETIQHQSEELIVNGHRLRANTKDLTMITGITNKVRP